MNVIRRNNSTVIILWGLVISKCLTLEYLIQVYFDTNSFFFLHLDVDIEHGGRSDRCLFPHKKSRNSFS